MMVMVMMMMGTGRRRVRGRGSGREGDLTGCVHALAHCAAGGQLHVHPVWGDCVCVNEVDEGFDVDGAGFEHLAEEKALFFSGKG